MSDKESHPVRGARIEIRELCFQIAPPSRRTPLRGLKCEVILILADRGSRTPRGVRGEIQLNSATEKILKKFYKSVDKREGMWYYK